MKKMLCAIIMLANVTRAQTPSGNLRIYPSAVTQTEPVIAVSPVNSNILFASGVTINTANGFRSEGCYVSTDAGFTWTGSDTCSGQLITNHGGDPSVMIHSNGRFILSHIGSLFPGVYSHYSTDLGRTWSNAYTISSTPPEDKGSTTIDNTPSSPLYGRLYSAWVPLVLPYTLSFSFSSDAGTSWTTPTTVNPSPPARCSGGTIATGVDGRVSVCWAGVISTAPFTEDFAGFASSTNGGLSWSVSQNIFDMNGINGTLPSKGNIRVNGLPQITIDNSGGPRRGWLYIVTTEKNLAPAGSDPDVLFRRSTNGGQTWSAAVRVNQDAPNNGKIQYFPVVDVDDYGKINIVYYDDRFTAPDSAEVFLAQSTDGGNSWSERVISDHRLKPKPIVGGASNYQGDHIAVKAVGRRLYALWMDDFSGIYQIWLATINIDPNSIESTSSDVPEDFELIQNYPNPFNPTTNIEFGIPHRSSVHLEVFDLIGQRVATLVDETKSPGAHSVSWDAGNSPSGLYFYRLQAGDFVATKKMLLIR